MFNSFGKSGPVRRISPRDAKAMLDNRSALLIDVRSAEEYRQVRIPGSKNIPLDAIGAHAQRLIPDKRQPIVVYCLSGGRSAQACALLARMGYESIFDLGGISTWPYETARG